MNKRSSPAQAAKRVLQAFPYPHVGAEVSPHHVGDHFRRHGYPVSEIVAGTHYAVSLGWVERTEIQSLKLTVLGTEAVERHPAPIPPSTFNVWAHP